MASAPGATLEEWPEAVNAFSEWWSNPPRTGKRRVRHVDRI
jgi:hypothetical protein